MEHHRALPHASSIPFLQAFGDAVVDECSMFVVTNYFVSFFFRRGKSALDKSVYCSPPVYYDGRGGRPPRAAFYFALKEAARLAEEKPDLQQEIVPNTGHGYPCIPMRTPPGSPAATAQQESTNPPARRSTRMATKRRHEELQAPQLMQPPQPEQVCLQAQAGERCHKNSVLREQLFGQARASGQPLTCQNPIGSENLGRCQAAAPGPLSDPGRASVQASASSGAIFPSSPAAPAAQVEECLPSPLKETGQPTAGNISRSYPPEMINMESVDELDLAKLPDLRKLRMDREADHWPGQHGYSSQVFLMHGVHVTCPNSAR